MDQLQLLSSLDLRYRGQSFEVNVPLAGDYLSAFHSEHERLYGYRNEQRPAEVVTLRLRVVGRGPRPDLTRGACRSGEAVPERNVPVFLNGRRIDCPLYERERLPCGGSFNGPALVIEETATHLVRPSWTVQADESGNLRLERI
jgi:N-methylhydantoinase A